MGYERFRRSAEQNAIALWCRSVRARDVILAALFVALVAS